MAITVTVKVTVKLIFVGVHLGNMQIRGPDTPNHDDKYSIEFAMLKNYNIDTKFAFLLHLVQRLSPKLLSVSDSSQY